MGCHFLLQEIFPSQGLNPGFPHCRQTLYRLSHQGSPLYIQYHLVSFCKKIICLLAVPGLHRFRRATFSWQCTGCACDGFSCRTARALGMAASVVAPQGLRVVAHELSCRATCGIFPDRRSNGCPLRCKAGSSPVDHQGSPQPQLTSASLFCCLGSSGCMFPLSVFGEPRRSQVFFGSSSSPADDPQRLPVSFRSSVCPAPSKCEADG